MFERLIMRYLITGLLLTIFSFSYSQEDLGECGSIDPIHDSGISEAEKQAIIQGEQRALQNLRNRSKGLVTKSGSVNQQVYIPVIFNFVLTEGAPESLWYDQYGNYTKTEEWALGILDNINERYSTGLWESTTYETEIDYGNQGADFNAILIPGNVDMDGNPHDWIREFTLEDSLDVMDPFYYRPTPDDPPNYAWGSYLDLDSIIPYTSPWPENPQIQAFTEDVNYNSVTMLNTFAYKPYDYLNIFVYGPICCGLRNAGANFPMSATEDDISGHIWTGQHLFFGPNTWNGFYEAAFINPDPVDYTDIPAHEVAHFFSLGHNWSFSSCSAAYTNYAEGDCSTTGDRVCDTPPTKSDYHDCYSTDPGDHCLSFGIPHNPSNIMDYTRRCGQMHFTQGQADKVRANFFDTGTNRYRIIERGYEIVGHDGGCLSDVNACNYSPGGSLDVPCEYIDALGVCGGTCESDSDGDGICDGAVGPSPCLGINSMLYMGITYDLIEIGDQCWFGSNIEQNLLPPDPNAENPNVTVSIPIATSAEEWMSYSDNEQPACAYPGGYDRVDLREPYGLLFNAYAIQQHDDICPTGFHVPTDDDFKKFERYLGLEEFHMIRKGKRESDENLGIRLTKGGDTGFEATLSGLIVESDGFHKDFGYKSYIWTSTPHRNRFASERNNIWYRNISRNNTGIGRYNEAWQTANNKGNGMSVRCLKD